MRSFTLIFLLFFDFALTPGCAFSQSSMDHLLPSTRRHSFVWPIEGKIISVYGPRGRRFHNGLDIKAAKGQEIRSIGPGKVIFSGTQKGYGKVVIVDHGDGIQSLYAHCQTILKDIRPQSLVEKGQIIGRVGATGNARGAHLHFEIRKDLEGTIDPRFFLVPQLALSNDSQHWTEFVP